MEEHEDWIFYLKLTKNLAEDFLLLDQKFKSLDRSLVPITVKTLLECTKKYHHVHVVVIVKSIEEYIYFQKRVKIIMKYLMRSQRVHLYIASSFANINDPSQMKRNFYHFARLPVRAQAFCKTVVRLIGEKEAKVHSWPGGVRPRVSLIG